MTSPNVSNSTKPQAMYDAAERYILPQVFGIGGEVADFWSTVFPDAGTKQDDYEQLVGAAIQQSGLVARTERVSFGQGVLLGKARPFYTIRRGSVTGTVYIGKLGQDLSDIYVSLRVLFLGTVSFAKTVVLWMLLTFIAAFPALLVFIPVWGIMGFLKKTYDCSAGNCYVNGQEIDPQNGIVAYLGTLIVLTLLFMVAFHLWSWWRYGDSQALVREDLDELHRDDLSALGLELYTALNAAADRLDFKRLSAEPQATPSFGATTHTNRTHKRRI
ncbi:MAG: hypothetical protein ABI947_17045 [Chloroflexota bacterium]